MNALEQIALCINGLDLRLRDILKLASLESGVPAIDDGIRNTITLAFAARQELSFQDRQSRSLWQGTATH